MIQRITVILIVALVMASCGAAAPAPTEAPVATEEPPPATEPPAIQSLNAPTVEPPVMETSTSAPTPTEVLPTPTDTPLPTLELPTEAVNAPVRMVWDGTPTYLGDSVQGYSFRITYDPDLWALTTDQMGFPALAHRNISACIITPTTGRGLPANTTVAHAVLDTGKVTFDVSVVSENGVKKFVTYTGGDGTIVTAFEVVFEEQSEECLEDAVTVLSTLTSVPVSRATPQP
jgi:hypothetical protein